MAREECIHLMDPEVCGFCTPPAGSLSWLTGLEPAVQISDGGTYEDEE